MLANLQPKKELQKKHSFTAIEEIESSSEEENEEENWPDEVLHAAPAPSKSSLVFEETKLEAEKTKYLSSELLTDDFNFRGKIIVAEDQHINIEVLKANLVELKCIQNCEFTFDGVETINLVKKIVSEGLKQNEAIHKG